jgi:hypothetical protein
MKIQHGKIRCQLGRDFYRKSIKGTNVLDLVHYTTSTIGARIKKSIVISNLRYSTLSMRLTTLDLPHQIAIF